MYVGWQVVSDLSRACRIIINYERVILQSAAVNTYKPLCQILYRETREAATNGRAARLAS